MKKIPPHVKRAASAFRKKRADYYRYFSQMLGATNGSMTVRQLFNSDAQRYAGTPRGVLTTYWISEFDLNGSKLGQAWEGTLPDDDVTLIKIAETAGGNALETSLEDAARAAELQDEIASTIKSTLAISILGFVLAIFMSTVFVAVAGDKLMESFSMVPVDEWGPAGRAYIAHGQRVKTWGIPVVCIALGVLFGILWTFNHLTGAMRNWLDRRLLIYRVFRDLKGAVFLATMASLTRPRTSGTSTLIASMQIYSSNVQSKYLRWRLREIIDRMQISGTTTVSVFDTELISRDMFFYLSDMGASSGFSEAFRKTGTYVESVLIKQILKQAVVLRWLILISAVVIVIGVVGWTISIPAEMRTVLQMHYA